jgi:nitrogen fixation protein FixH
MNWGYKIMIVIYTFIAIMIGMVVLASQQKNELVETNYYDAEINYQSMINAAKHLNAITNDSLLQQNAQSLLLQIPVSLVAGFQNGKISLLKSDNQQLDKKMVFTPDANGSFRIEKSTLSSGTYKASIEFTSQSIKYYREQTIILN